jgi:hypothetical protein
MLTSDDGCTSVGAAVVVATSDGARWELREFVTK